jgi:hypothetical protein
MSVQIEAHFDSRDAADFAVARLRRNGISFNISDIRPARGRQHPSDHTIGGVSMLFPFVQGDIVSTNSVNTWFEPYGSRAILAFGDHEFSGIPESSETVVSVSVADSSAERAEAILRNAHGYGIRLRH